MNSIKKYSKEQLIILTTIISLLLPYYITTIYFSILTIYLLFKYKNIISIKNKANKLILCFFTLITLTSIVYQNWLGLFVAIILFCIFYIALFIKKYCTNDLFELCLEILLVISLIWACVAMVQYMNILDKNNIDHFVIKFFSKRDNRITAVMMNANYYAQVLEMIILVGVYKLFKNKDNIKLSIYYVFVNLINIFMLLLTSSRTGWLGLIAGLFVLFILNKNYNIVSIYIIGGIIVVIYFLLNIDKIPRIDYLLSNLGVRGLIWSTAVEGIKNNPLFGQGPMTYMLIFESLAGHNTHHSHSIILEPILSFGIVGCIPLILLIKKYFIFLLQFIKNNILQAALILGSITAVLTHGLTDFSIFFIQPGFIFLFISLSIYYKK